MSTPLSIRYLFHFSNGNTKEIPIMLDASTLDLFPRDNFAPPTWARIGHHTCKSCPLDPLLHPHCPTAVHFAWVLDELQGYDSYEDVTVEVIDSIRSYRKETSLQDGLGSLMGLVMPTGGCPLLQPLRPMVRFHLPFASLEEMEYRMVSMYLFAQYLRQQNGEHADWTLDGLQAIYEKVIEVNKAFSDRVRTAFHSDAGINSIIILDCFAQTIPKAIQNTMRDFNKFFFSYMRQTATGSGGMTFEQ
jgi:hypothetical protein